MTHTTLQQAKELIKLGLENKSADLVYCIRREDCTIPWEEAAKNEKNVLLQLRPFNGCLSDYTFPCWSAEALLEILPDEVYIDEEEDTACLKIMKVGAYIVSYDSKERDDIPNYIHSMGDDLADVLFKIIKWLLTNKLI